MKITSGKLKESSRWPFIGTVLAVCIVIILLFLILSAKKETAFNEENKTPRKQLVRQDNESLLNGGVMIQSVRIQPSLPTRLDTIRAEVISLSNGSGDLKFTYVWRVNGQIIAEATGDTLDLSPFKKRDLISVTVTPCNEKDIAGYAVNSPVVAIHSIPPSLEMKTVNKMARIGEPYTLQLFSDHPDSETATFSLEEPKIGGMTIDGQTGKISWVIQPNQKGTVRFGTAVLDSEGTRVTKIFVINMDQQQSTPQTP